MNTRKKRRGNPKQKVDIQKLHEGAARSYLDPGYIAANAIRVLNRDTEIKSEDGGIQGDEGVRGLDFSALADELDRRNKSLAEGDLTVVEEMLLDQSHVLQSLFVFFTQNMARAEYMTNLETYSRIALKAQNQCRQTLATLVELKNPKRATFIKQQNTAVNQQINQGENPKNLGYPANKILEEIPSERLEPRTPQAAIGVNQEVEAMGENHRTKDGRREKEG